MRMIRPPLGDRRFSRRQHPLPALLALAVLSVLIAILACDRRGGDRGEGSGPQRLRAATTTAESRAVRGTVYVPVYSSLSLGRDIKQDVVQLTCTLSVRNASPRYPIVIELVRYYDSHGRPVRDYLATPAELEALASVEFVVKEADTVGGPGANFLVTWSGPSAVDQPVIEAVMLGRSASAGISFTSVGRSITNEPQR